jgi:hypothetical protein
VNQAEASLDVNGATSAPTVAGQELLCVGELATVNIDSTNVGSGWDMAISTAPLAPRSGAGFALAGGGDIVNIDLSQSIFLNGAGPLPNLLPFPGTIAAPITPNTALTLSAQVFVLDAGSAAGIAVSGCVTIDAAAGTTTSVAGPTGDDNSVVVDVSAPPLCWCPTGVPFYGLLYNELNVASNGRVLFGGTDDDFSVSIPEALGDNPFVGLWADLSPNAAGSITLSSPAPGLARVDWVGVPYYNQPTATNTYGVEFNCATGDVIIDGLMSIVPDPSNTNQFLGMSPGNVVGATDPGVQPFGLGAAGAAANATDMLYDFAPGITLSLASGTLSSIVFSPDGGGNYIWFGL